MLLAGGDSDLGKNPSECFVFNIQNKLMDTDWGVGSALFLLYISIVYYMCRKEV